MTDREPLGHQGKSVTLGQSAERTLETVSLLSHSEDMANPEHLEILKQGVEAWNKWRADNPDVIPDLSEAKLPGANLFDVNLSGAELSSANLTGADLSEADLGGANLMGTDLNVAMLSPIVGQKSEEAEGDATEHSKAWWQFWKR